MIDMVEYNLLKFHFIMSIIKFIQFCFMFLIKMEIHLDNKKEAITDTVDIINTLVKQLIIPFKLVDLNMEFLDR
jgi:hypothetical protein